MMICSLYLLSQWLQIFQTNRLEDFKLIQISTPRQLQVTLELMWMQVSPKIHQLVIRFVRQLRPCENEFSLSTVSQAKIRSRKAKGYLQSEGLSPEFEAVNFKANLHPHSPRAE